MARDTIKVRIALDGGQEIVTELRGLGKDGEKALKQLQKIGNLKADEALKSLRRMGDQLKSLGKQASDFGEKMRKVGQGFSTFVTLPLAGAGVGILKQAADFEKATNDLAVNAGIAGDAFDTAKEKAKELGQASVFSSTEAAQGMTELAKVGLDFQQIMGGAADAMVNLAAANNAGLEASAGVVGDIINQFKLSASQLPALVNSITGATNESKLSFDDYRLAIGQAGGVAGALGVKFEEFNAVLASTASAFASGSDAGTSFKTFLTRLVPQTKEAAALFKEMNLQFFDSQGNMRSMADIAEELRRKFSKLSQQDLNEKFKTIFGVDSMRTAIALMRQGGDGIDAMMKKLKATDAANIAAVRVKGLAGELDQFNSAVENLSIAIGDSGLLGFITDMVTKATNLAQAIAKLNPETLKLGTIIGGLASTIGPVLIGLGLFGKGIGFLIGGVGELLIKLRLLTLLIRANPWITAITLVGTALLTWIANTDSATKAMERHKGVVDNVAGAYEAAGRKVAEMTQQTRDRLLLESRGPQDTLARQFEADLANLKTQLERMATLADASNPFAKIMQDFADGKITLDQFAASVTAIGKASPEFDVAALKLLGMSDAVQKLGNEVQVGQNWIDLLTGKITDADFATRQAALGVAGYADAVKNGTAGASTDLKNVGTAATDAAAKVEDAGRRITVTRFGSGELQKTTYELQNGIVVGAQQAADKMDELGKKSGDAASKAASSVGVVRSLAKDVGDAASGAADGIDDTITNSIDQIAPAAQQAAADVSASLGSIDAGAAAAAAEAIIAPFQSLPAQFSAILNGISALINGGFGNLSSLVNSLASQIESAISRILSALRAAAAEAARLRSAAGSSGGSSSTTQGFASGGHVRGAGGPTSDSILAWLSNGEFVMRAAVVKRLGVDFFHAINNGILPSLKGLRGFSVGGLVDGIGRSLSVDIPRFAGGGFANMQLAPAASGGGFSGTPVTIVMPDGERFDTVAPVQVAAKLSTYATGSATLSAGRKPGWYK
jgi:TP901 family phage tail tape measure protein